MREGWTDIGDGGTYFIGKGDAGSCFIEAGDGGSAFLTPEEVPGG